MKTENAMQLKAKINSKAKELNIAPQFVLQNYIMECFIKRISLSEYKDNFILKGGLLIASLVGLQNRSTMDMDTTITGFKFFGKDCFYRIGRHNNRFIIKNPVE